MHLIRTLLLTGANNHDWRRTTPFVRHLLESTGLFEVTIAENASQSLEANVSVIDLFFLDYNGPLWSEKAQTHFLDAVRGGAGVCIFHADNNAFNGWAEYEKMVALPWREGKRGTFPYYTDLNWHQVNESVLPLSKAPKA